MRERVWRRSDFDGVDERRHESRKPGLGSRHRRRVAFLWEDAHDPNPADGRQHVNYLTIHSEHVRVEGDRVLEAPIGQFLRRDRPEEHFQGPRGAAQKTFHLREDRSRASATSISVRVTSTASVSSGPSPSKKRRRCDALSEVIVEGRATTKKPDDDGTNRRTRSSATAAGAAFAVFAGVTNATAARARRATAQSSTKKRCRAMVSRRR